jgi:hypothetical protein
LRLGGAQGFGKTTLGQKLDMRFLVSAAVRPDNGAFLLIEVEKGSLNAPPVPLLLD